MPTDGPDTLPSSIIASAQGALKGQTPKPLRQYSFDYSWQNGYIRFRAEVDRPLTEDEREDLAVAETEIMSDFLLNGDDSDLTTEIVVVPVPQALSPLPGGVAYRREDERTNIP